MADACRQSDDQRVEQVMGNLLRFGVLLAALVVLAGGIIYLCRHGGEPAEFHDFQGEPRELTSPSGIVTLVLQGRGRGIIQFGLLLLIATPVARVVFSVGAFARERDRTYIALTLFVLAVLAYSLCSGYLNP